MPHDVPKQRHRTRQWHVSSCLLQSGNDIYDLGETLYTFLLRYGEEFNYEHEAVSVASGGIVPKV